MAMKNFLLGLSKFVLGIILAMLIMTLAGASMVRYFMARSAETPERPIYENDRPEDQPVAAEPAANNDSDDNIEPEPEPEPELVLGGVVVEPVVDVEPVPPGSTQVPATAGRATAGKRSPLGHAGSG